MRDQITDLLASQLTTSFLKSGLKTKEFLAYLVETRGDNIIDLKVSKENASIQVLVPLDPGDSKELTICTFTKHYRLNYWDCKI